MKSAETLNELLEKLRLGKIEGTIKIKITNKGRVNKILIKKINEEEEDKNEITHKVIEIQQEKPELKADFSHLEVQGEIPGFDLHESNFSYSRVLNSDLSYANLKDVPFYKAMITQSDMSNAYGVNMNRAYITGSVNFYNTQSSIPDIVNPLDAPFHGHDHGEY